MSENSIKTHQPKRKTNRHLVTEDKLHMRLPEWFRYSKEKLNATKSLSKRLQMENVPNSICEEAKCPNRSECFTKGVLTFMILGTVCTRNCGFCSVAHGKPLPPDPKEVNTILSSIDRLDLKFVVLTSPDRDDLKDGGSAHYRFIVESIKSTFPHVKVEVLIPDFKGSFEALETVMSGQPDVVNHNMETVPELYTIAKRGSIFTRSLSMLKQMKVINPNALTKSGLIVGLGETKEQLVSTLKEIKTANVDILTVGQYLKPSRDNLEVARYYHPDEFKEIEQIGLEMGFRYIFSGPSVRSSFLAEHVFDDMILKSELKL